ncbi:MAG: hypothetical protein A2381_07560 [Bdellovibrionales bacterium RIFOXYB1_FULL_37_110]|nr:MAG: hypothetical protein A2181_04325 [Bdellovibrionales bacterium RIFOXYA1_FULL_38_20]OFZ52464.1 MAG: hypothetical protein A2417_00280 [Bdellovibrionales bacterium RIFOXYC1_FULL_37_79]OFZ59666.1 MAG: hypothetical protein A2381_07560 [Bdellovibrionales bacterium RIFOXYB1_FULL_37_110]OFZ62593.1 MAG: hypothetical protein A2577_11880 [Bdellovibrionales bacterium RIFOXYD1_FULL_36_51]
MKVRPWKYIYFAIGILSIVLLASCSKEIFGTKKNKATSSVAQKDTFTSDQICSEHSVVKPKVDFLFLWDNSASQTYVEPALRNGFNNLVNRISSNFDHHILMAPLIRSTYDSVDVNSFLVSYDNTGLTSSALNRQVPYTIAASKLDQIVSTLNGGNQENGFYRAYEIINNNRTNGIFRNNAYLMIVVMSNGDVRTYNNGYWVHPYILTTDKNRLLNLRSTLGNEQMRFMSLVSHAYDGIPSGYKKGYAYIAMSSQIYYDAGQTIRPTDQEGRPDPDSYNIAGADYNRIFDGINQSITMVTVAHQYNYWPVALQGNFDPLTLRVTKYTASGSTSLTPNDTTNGFVYLGHRNNQNTRYAPTPGEPYTGNVVRLYGSGRVKYPDCVVVAADEQASYYGYFTLSGKPNPSSIQCTKNGTTVTASTSNGFEYIGYVENKNVKIESPSNPDTPGTPAVIQSGFMLKLRGSAIYTNGETFECYFDPGT